jgi:hypothetical protein
MDDRDLLIDTILDTYPLSPTPPDFRARVINEVQKLPRQAQSRPAFRLEYVDVVFPVFFAVFSAGLLAVNLSVLLSLDKLTRMKLDLQAKMVMIRLMALPNQLATFTIPVAVWLPVITISVLGLVGVVIALGIWALQSPLHLAEK